MKNKSIEELEKLIAENNAEAMYEMGIYLSKNENSTDKDYNKAVKYFKKAEELGYIKGKYGIARSYYYGIGVEQDYEKAYTMFYELMTQYNDPDAKYYIGQMYYYGELVKKDYKKAEKYLKNSITEDDCAPEYYLGCIYKEGGYGIDKDCKKSKEYFGKVECDLCKTLIYHSLAVSVEG